MNIYKGIDGGNTFLLSNIDYDVLSTIKSALTDKISMLNSRIITTKTLINETSDVGVIKQLKKEISYLEELKSKIESVTHSMHNALTDL